MASAPQRTCTERPARILCSASAAASGSEDCVTATTPRVASQTTAISEEDLPKSAGEDPPLLGQVHSRTEDFAERLLNLIVWVSIVLAYRPNHFVVSFRRITRQRMLCFALME